MDKPQISAHHVAISVVEMEGPLSFYAHFGFGLLGRWADPEGVFEIAHLDLGSLILEMFCFRNCVPAPESAANLETDLPRLGVKHLGLSVKSLGEAEEWLRGLGIALEVPVTEGKTGIRYLFVKDPSGNLLELVEDRRGLVPPSVPLPDEGPSE